jgi:hypothetical protein
MGCSRSGSRASTTFATDASTDRALTNGAYPVHRASADECSIACEVGIRRRCERDSYDLALEDEPPFTPFISADGASGPEPVTRQQKLDWLRRQLQRKLGRGIRPADRDHCLTDKDAKQRCESDCKAHWSSIVAGCVANADSFSQLVPCIAAVDRSDP